MADSHLTKKNVESCVASAFRKQFSELNFRSNPDIKILGLDTSGNVGFNEIQVEDFCGEGTYMMHGWAKVFGENNGIINSFWISFDIDVTIEKEDESVKVSFLQPIFIRRK